MKRKNSLETTLSKRIWEVRLKKYYCPNCKEFKSRLQLKREDDTRVTFFTCRWCHNSNIYSTEDILCKLIDKTLKEQDLNNKHGSYL